MGTDPSNSDYPGQKTETAEAFRAALSAILKLIVSRPDDLLVLVEHSISVITLEVRSSPKDVGRIVGQSGSTADSLRSLFGKAASRAGWDHCIIHVPQAPPASFRSGRPAKKE